MEPCGLLHRRHLDPTGPPGPPRRRVLAAALVPAHVPHHEAGAGAALAEDGQGVLRPADHGHRLPQLVPGALLVHGVARLHHLDVRAGVRADGRGVPHRAPQDVHLRPRRQRVHLRGPSTRIRLSAAVHALALHGNHGRQRLVLLLLAGLGDGGHRRLHLHLLHGLLLLRPFQPAHGHVRGQGRPRLPARPGHGDLRAAPRGTRVRQCLHQDLQPV
mmetsp:Transcript_39878/g.118245  ORF Transcript_39878/g.118245 Transcript_39878/m.118245 type:complete len:216 (+) Transcript_39878:1460-2107(+)